MKKENRKITYEIVNQTSYPPILKIDGQELVLSNPTEIFLVKTTLDLLDRVEMLEKRISAFSKIGHNKQDSQPR